MRSRTALGAPARTAIVLARCLLAIVLGACSTSDPRGTTERCGERAIELVLDGDPRVVALPEARSIGTCGRGDRSAEIAIRVGLPEVNTETLILARSESGDALVLVAQARCGDPTSILSCAASAGDEEIQLTRPEGDDVFVLVRSLSGRASNVTLRARSRMLHRVREPCDPASASPGCASDPGCYAIDRCRDGLVCVDGACRGATVGIGGSCDGVQRCQPELVCLEGLCASPVGSPCDVGPAFCADFRLACLDGICRSAFSEEGDRCSPRAPPTCSGSLACVGEPGAEVCVDLLGLTCDAAEVLPVSTVDAPTAPLSFTIDPASPSEHASSCGEGNSTPDRVFQVQAPTAGPLHIVVTSTVGPPPLIHLRGPSACDQFSGGCAQRGEITSFTSGTEPWFAIVEGGGEHTIRALTGEVVSGDGACDVDPHRFCDHGFGCVSGVCRAVSDASEGGPCYCFPGGVVDPAFAISRLRGVLAPGGEQWFQLNPSRPFESLRFESILCPLDLEVEIFDGSASCEMARCTPTMLDTLGSAALADGTSCTSADVALTREAPFDVRLRIRSVIGGEYELSVTAPP